MRPSFATTLVFPAALFAVSVTAAGKCYGVNGADRDDSFVPCNPAADVSACCASNKSGGDLCIANGLCLAAGGAYTGFIYGNGCTDKSGKDSACPSICPLADSDFWGKSDDLVSWNLLQCNPGTWCCRRPNNSSSCCNDKRAQVKWNLPQDGMFLPELFLGNTIPLSTTTSTSAMQSRTTTATTQARTTATTNVASTTGTSGAALSSATNTPAEDKDGVNPSTVGIAVGVSLGALLLIAIGVIVWLVSKNRSLQRQNGQSGSPYVPPTYYKYASDHAMTSPPPVELHSPPTELHGHGHAQYPQYGSHK